MHTGSGQQERQSGELDSPQARTVSHAYLRHVKRRLRLPKFALLAVTILAVVIYLVTSHGRQIAVAAVSLLCWLLVGCYEGVLGFRIRRGYFGSEEEDVRRLMQFIEQHAGHDDFTDQGGKRLPVFPRELPEDDSEVSSPSTAHDRRVRCA